MRVLHLEDDGPLREILAAAMIAVAPDCQLRQFKSSDNALMYASKHGKSVDLFIVDIRVPGEMNGLEFAQRVRELNCPGVIVITSAYSPPEESLLEEIKGKWYPKPWHIFETTQKLFELAQQHATEISSDTSSEASSTPPKPATGTAS
jgi:DNA-binding response OmpR family regulator